MIGFHKEKRRANTCFVVRTLLVRSSLKEYVCEVTGTGNQLLPREYLQKPSVTFIISVQRLSHRYVCYVLTLDCYRPLGRQRNHHAQVGRWRVHAEQG